MSDHQAECPLESIRHPGKTSIISRSKSAITLMNGLVATLLLQGLLNFIIRSLTGRPNCNIQLPGDVLSMPTSAIE